MNGVLTSAPVSRSTKRKQRQPRPLPEWAQFTAVLLCVLQFCGQVTLNRLLTTTDAAGIVVSNTYDAVGNKLAVVDGGNHTTSFAYDGMSRNTAVTDAAGKSAQLRYDAMNKVQRIDALGQTTSYLYDVRNRLSNVVYASSAAANSQRNYAYDAVGNLPPEPFSVS